MTLCQVRVFVLVNHACLSLGSSVPGFSLFAQRLFMFLNDLYFELLGILMMIDCFVLRGNK